METRKKIEARHPRAMQARAEKSMHHRAARAIRQWLIVFILLTAGAATAAADGTIDDHGTVDVNGVRYHLYHCKYMTYHDDMYYAYVEAFVGSPSEVTILKAVKNGSKTYSVDGLRWRITGVDEWGRSWGERTATIASTSVLRINFECSPYSNGEAGNPTFNCPNLRTVYFNGGTPNFQGNFEDIFGLPINVVTAYVEGVTQEQCNQLKSSNAVWGGFYQVIAYLDKFNFRLGGNSGFVVDLGNYSSFAESGAQNQEKVLNSGQSKKLRRGKNYAVVCYNNDPEKIPTLKRNGTPVTVSYVTHGSTKYAYYNETNLQADVDFQWSWTSAKVSCTMSSNSTCNTEMFVVNLGDYSSFTDPNAPTLAKLLYIAKGSGGPKTADLPKGKNYAVVYVNSDPAKIPTLKRNGTAVTLNTVTHGSVKYAYYTETDLQENVTYQWNYSNNSTSVTLKNETNGTVFISELGAYENFNQNGAQNQPHLIDLYGKGSVTKDRIISKNYATVYVNTDPTKIPKLTITNLEYNVNYQEQTSVEPQLDNVTYDGVNYVFYKIDTRVGKYQYKWSTTDKTCNVTFTQKQLPDSASKTGTMNITNGGKKWSIASWRAIIKFSQGSTMEIDIPFDPAVQTLNSIRVGGANTAFLPENGHYKATIPVPLSKSLAVELIWNEPIEPDPVVLPEPIQRKPPKAMIVRSGEGEVVFKGKGYLEVGQDDYEWRDQVTMDCSDPVSTVTVPHLGMRNEVLDDTEWGFRVEMKPVQGEVLRSLRIGWIDTDEETDRPIMRWDDFLNNPDYSNSSYMSYDEATGTYVFEALGDEMNFPKGDYTILVDMGPETVTAEERNVQTIVRKGGTGNAKIFYELECNEPVHDINEGSVIVTLPDYGDDCETYVYLEIAKVEGEKFTAYRDGEDVTGEFKEFENCFTYAFDDHSLPVSERGRGRHSSSWMILIEKENAEAVQTIPFTDEVVKQICVENWDTDGDGELSFVEAQDVTSLGGVFAQTSIETFDELKYFTGLTEIGNEEFWHCDELKKVTLPPTITSIGEDSFYGCPELQSIELPNTLVEIGSGAFTYSSLREIRIPANVLVLDYGFSDSSVELIVIDKGNPLYETGIYNNAIIEKETQTVVALCDNAPIPEGVRRLGDYFWMRGGYSVTQMVVPASVEEIGGGAFNTYLETLTMKRREPIAFNINFFFNQSNLPANCKLIVPFGTRDAYIAAGWTEDIFKGGVVEDDSVLDVNGDGVINPQDALKVIEKYMDQ